MNKVVLTRSPSSDQGTFGTLSFGTSICYTTELPWRDNLVQKSCIPTGTYVCKIVNSPKFGRVYGIQDVPLRSNVLIHPANFGGNSDKGWITELHGCISPAMKLGVMRNKNGILQKAGIVSRPAVRALMEWANGESFTLEIK